MLNVDEATTLSFTTDVWTSGAVEAYLTLTGHFVTADFSLVSWCLGTAAFPERHTGMNIAEKVKIMLAAFRVPERRQAALVHDQASNMQTAGDTLREGNDAFFSVVCAPHRLQNTIKAGLQIPRVSNLLASARKIVTHFKHSVVGMEAIRKRQDENGEKRLKFVQDVSTRWNSSLDMMKRLLVLRPHITAVLRDSSVTKKDDKNLNLSPEQYGLMESLIGILTPFKDATTLLSAEKSVTISYVLHFVLELASVLETKESDSVTVSTLKAAMLKDLNTRFNFKQFDAETIEAMSSLLDPRFHHMSLLARPVYEEVVDAVKERLQRLCLDDDAESSDEERDDLEPAAKRKVTALERMLACKLSMDKEKKKVAPPAKRRTVEEEFDAYLKEPEIDVNCDPLCWWKAHAETYPRISLLARKWLGIPASSTSSERLCSTAGHVTEQRRCSLTPENVNMLVFLNKNWSLISSTPAPSAPVSNAAAAKNGQPAVSVVALTDDADDMDDDLPELPTLF